MLSGIETTKEKVLRIILAGQPELNDKLNSPELVQLAQRVRLRFHLSALSSSETRRLHPSSPRGRRLAGTRAYFADDTYPTIFRYTGGVPRLINTLCDTAMMAAFGRDSDTVTARGHRAAIQELQWVEFSARTNRMQHVARSSAAQPPSAAGDAASRVRRASCSPAAARRCWSASCGRAARHRPHAGQRPADRQPIHQPPPLPDHDSAHSCVIEDLNSTNGIYVKSKRVRRHNLNDGDVVLVGQHEIMYIDERAAARTAYRRGRPESGSDKRS